MRRNATLQIGLAFCLAVACGPLAGPTDAPAGEIRVYLLAGQSNADGRAAVSGLPMAPVDLRQPQADVAFFVHTQGAAHPLDSTLTTLRPGMSETSGFGPEITLGRSLADAWADRPDTAIAIVKYANGGTNLSSQWKGGGDATRTGDGPEYATLQDTVAAALAALAAAHPDDRVVIGGVVWMQGEADTGSDAQAAAYQANLAALIADVRSTWGDDLPFVIGRLSSGQTALNAANLAAVRAAQTAVADADPRAARVDTDAMSLKADALHFDAAGQQALGTAFADRLLALDPPAPAAVEAPAPSALTGAATVLHLTLGSRRPRR